MHLRAQQGHLAPKISRLRSMFRRSSGLPSSVANFCVSGGITSTLGSGNTGLLSRSANTWFAFEGSSPSLHHRHQAILASAKPWVTHSMYLRTTDNVSITLRGLIQVVYLLSGSSLEAVYDIDGCLAGLRLGLSVKREGAQQCGEGCPCQARALERPSHK